MSALLQIPSQMNLSLYLDMRMTTVRFRFRKARDHKLMYQAYESLWDDITKQFLQHTDETVLTSAIQAINELTLNSALGNSNSTKLAELTETLFTSLRDAINGEDVLTMSLGQEEIASIEAILLRMTLLGKSRDITEVMEDEEGGQSSGWEIACAFAERGELPYKEEAKVS
jgi:cohesin complex subunit SA-1/2